MSTQNRIVSLRQIPQAVFAEFSVSLEPQQYAIFPTDLGDICSIRISLAKESGANGPFTLLHEDYECRVGRFHRTQFRVYNYPVKIGEFNPRYNGHTPDPKLTIRFFADDPPYHPWFGKRWEDGRGFWVNEYLDVRYGTGPNHTALVTSDVEDGEFGFFLEVQKYAHKLAHDVAIRGHWQQEWNPTGDFSMIPPHICI